MERRTQFRNCHKGHDLCLHRLEPQSPLWIPTKAVLSLVLCLKCTIYIYYCSCLLPPLNLEFSLDYGYDCQSFKSENQDTCSDRKCIYRICWHRTQYLFQNDPLLKVSNWFGFLCTYECYIDIHGGIWQWKNWKEYLKSGLP